MKSPFPGMDPYLEGHWGDLHHRLIQYAGDALQPGLPNDLRAWVEERVFLATWPDYDIPLEHRSDYLACVSSGWRPGRRELYVMPLRQRLPVLPIPLRQHERPLPLDVQSLLDHAYAAGRYDDTDYRAALEPPLSSEDAAWAAELLQAAGTR